MAYRHFIIAWQGQKFNPFLPVAPAKQVVKDTGIWLFFLGSGLELSSTAPERTADREGTDHLVRPFSSFYDSFSPRSALYLMCFAKSRMTSSTSMGLATWAFMPQSRERFTSSAKASAVMAMMGRSRSGRSRVRITWVAS